MATESVTTEVLTLARAELTTDSLWEGAATPVRAIGANLEDALVGLSGVMELLDRDERNLQSAEHNDGVVYDGLGADMRERLRLAARLLMSSAREDIDSLREWVRGARK